MTQERGVEEPRFPRALRSRLWPGAASVENSDHVIVPRCLDFERVSGVGPGRLGHQHMQMGRLQMALSNARRQRRVELRRAERNGEPVWPARWPFSQIALRSSENSNKIIAIFSHKTLSQFIKLIGPREGVHPPVSFR